MSSEGYANPTVLNGTPGNSAPVSGGRRRSLKKVSAKKIRSTLRKLGMKPKGRVVLKGGEDPAAPPAAPTPAGGKRRSASASHRRASMRRRGGEEEKKEMMPPAMAGKRKHTKRSLFGIRY
jgi:hypothetical protein